jgi:small subunit ribosomal protein S18
MQPKTPQRRTNFRKANRSMPRRRVEIPLADIDYKNTEILKRYVTENGKILSRRTTGLPAHFHRKVTRMIKRARQALLMR